MANTSADRFGILFVCLGNICRSPLAEGICQKIIDKRGLTDRIFIDSCGTGSWHIGKPPHPESQRVARENGIDISRQRARQVERADRDIFSLIVAMDESNAVDIRRDLKPSSTQLVLLRQFDPEKDSFDVPDPYFGNGDGFHHVYTILERSMGPLIEHVVSLGDRQDPPLP